MNAESEAIGVICHELCNGYAVEVIIDNSIEFLPHRERATLVFSIARIIALSAVQTGNRRQITLGESENFADGNQRGITR